MSAPVKSDSQNTTQEMSEEQKKKALLKAERKKQFEAQWKASQANAKENEAKTKSKSELKAERRAKQELQRSAKSNTNKEPVNKNDNQNNSKSKTNTTLVDTKTNTSEESADKTKQNYIKNDVKTTSFENSNKDLNSSESKQPIDTKTSNTPKALTTTTSTTRLVKRGQIFAHIPQRIHDITQLNNDLNSSSIHPVVIQVGFQINKNVIKGSNARCVAMLSAFKRVIQEYITPPSKELARDLESTIDSYVKFLAKCRPLSISMTNAVKFLKLSFSKISAETKDSNAKRDLCDSIDNFIYDEIICAQRGIAELAITKVNDDSDVILTFGCSLIVKHVLYNAAKNGKKFRVVVVDSRPRFDGREMLKYLLQHNIAASYILINAVSYVMKEVTKVLLGAHSLLANGYVMSHIGSSQIALVAHAYNVPVLVCCETYKFSERVHTDSFVHNELGDSTDFLNSLTTSGKFQIEQNVKDLNTLDLLYDVTPHEFVSVVITEKGVLPCISAPAVLRVRETK